ncbi:MAG: hypothetical protein AAF557_26295 [Pseudomonadota bacterium]
MTSQKTWWDFYDEDPYEKIGREVSNAFGRSTVIALQRVTWAYMDWVQETEEADFTQFFIDNELIHRPADGSFDDWMEGAVRKAFLCRERNGAPRPEWLPPADPIEYADI